MTRPYAGAFARLGGEAVHIWRVRTCPFAGPGPGIVQPRPSAAAGEGAIMVGAGDSAVEILDASFAGDESPAAFARVRGELLGRGRFDAA